MARITRLLTAVFPFHLTAHHLKLQYKEGQAPYVSLPVTARLFTSAVVSGNTIHPTLNPP